MPPNLRGVWSSSRAANLCANRTRSQEEVGKLGRGRDRDRRGRGCVPLSTWHVDSLRRYDRRGVRSYQVRRTSHVARPSYGGTTRGHVRPAPTPAASASATTTPLRYICIVLRISWRRRPIWPYASDSELDQSCYCLCSSSLLLLLLLLVLVESRVWCGLCSPPAIAES